MLDETVNGTISLRICQEGHANALALNKDSSQIAVAGRSLLKLYAIESDGFTEVCNMRGGKNQNLSYSSNDVAWSLLDINILATAATNGVVSVWDLSKFGRQKQLLVYNDHERTAHTVTFHNTEINLLISGSQDGTIKCFDIRCDKAIYTFNSNSESVRDVKFNPQCSNIFSAVSENGTVQLWDLRRGEKCLLQFTAHSGPIYTCDWHPNNNWLATGSRDKQIKVWNMDGKASLEYTIHTIAVVGRVKWRPEFTYHIASCALVVDYSIHVWDIRRPFIPFASFNEHTNITTDIGWKGNDGQHLLSTGKDSTIYKHAFRDATRPALRANSQGVSLSRKCDISFANKRKVPPQTTGPISAAAHLLKTSGLISRSSKNNNGVDQFHIAESNMCRFLMKSTLIGVGLLTDIRNPSLSRLKEHESFIGCAHELILRDGRKLSEICEHNADICRKYGKYNAITLWNLVKILYGSNEFNGKPIFEHRNSFSNQKKSCCNVARRSVQLPNKKHNSDNLHHLHHISNADHRHFHHRKSLNNDESNDRHNISNNLDDLDDGSTMDNGESQQNYPYKLGSVILSESQILSEITVDNFELLRNGFIYVGPTDYTKALAFPDTALHCDVQEAGPQVDRKVETNRDRACLTGAHTNHPVSSSTKTGISGNAEISQPIIKIQHAPTIPMWQPHQFLADALKLQNDIGDVQTALSILIVLGEKYRKYLPIEENLVEHWFQTYIDQLHRYQMWNEACTIINLSWINSVQEQNQKSTTVYINCGDCGRPLGGGSGTAATTAGSGISGSTSYQLTGGNSVVSSGVGWYCQKCRSMKSAVCCVCGLIVRGLYAWCQGCSHGGHVEHLMEYFANHSICPKCGHLCEYN